MLLLIFFILLPETHQFFYSPNTCYSKYCLYMKNGPTKPKKISTDQYVYTQNTGPKKIRGEGNSFVEYNRDSGRKLEYEFLKSNTGNFVRAIKQRSQEDNEMNLEERSALYSLLTLHVPTMTTSYLASTVFSLGIFITNSKSRLTLKEELKVVQKALAQPAVISQLTSYDIVSVIVGMARMQAQWSDVCNDKAQSISYRLSTLMNDMDDRAVGDAVWALGSMGARFSDFPKPLQSNILQALEREGGKLNSYALSSALWALAKMGAKWYYFSGNLQERFLSRGLELGPLMSPQQSSKLIWALGTTGATHETYPDYLLEFHLVNVGKIKKSQIGFAVSASQTLTGLAKTGINWDKISPTMKAALWEQLFRVCQSTNERGVANAIWAMGTIGAPVSAQPEVVRDAMLSAASSVMTGCSAWALCNIVWGLAKMQLDWNMFPRPFKDALMFNVRRLEKEMNSVDVGILVWSLGALDTPLDTLSMEFVEALLLATLRNLEGMRAQELSRTIWGLSGSGLDWDSIPAPLRWNINVALRRVEDDLSPQDIANCAYGLALLAFDSQTPEDAAFRGAHEVLLNTIKKTQRTKESVSLMNEQELEQIRIFSHYLKVMNYVTDTRRIPEQLLDSAGGVVNMKAVQVSKLQRRVVQGIQSAFKGSSGDSDQYEISNEVSSFDGAYPLDAAVRKRGKIVALLEVDGPHHYRPDGRLRRKDKLKEAMYMKRHPDSTFHRIRWDEADKIGILNIGTELVQHIMSRNKEEDGFTRFRKRFMKMFNDFISWGLRNTKER